MAVRKIFTLAVCLWPIAVSGCSMLHDLQPHRMRRLNRVSPPHLDPEFTRRDVLSEPIVVRAQNEEAQGKLSLGFRSNTSSQRD